MKRPKTDQTDREVIKELGRQHPDRLSQYHAWWKHRREVAAKVFGPLRADELNVIATSLAKKSTISALNSFEVIMQIDEEFPGRAEEFVSEADDLVDEHDTSYAMALEYLVKIKRLNEQH